jgi:hypothetical protein
MFFLNSDIIKNCNDVKIGGIKIEQSEISYLGYIQSVRIRIFKLVIEFIKSDMADGASYENSILDCKSLIHETLTFEEKSNPNNEEELVSEIMNSEEFNNWSTDIKYRFFNSHEGIVDTTTPIPTVNGYSKDIMQETLELVQNEDTLQVLLDGLANTNYLD